MIMRKYFDYGTQDGIAIETEVEDCLEYLVLDAKTLDPNRNTEYSNVRGPVCMPIIPGSGANRIVQRGSPNFH